MTQTPSMMDRLTHLLCTRDVFDSQGKPTLPWRGYSRWCCSLLSRLRLVVTDHVWLYPRSTAVVHGMVVPWLYPCWLRIKLVVVSYSLTNTPPLMSLIPLQTDILLQLYVSWGPGVLLLLARIFFCFYINFYTQFVYIGKKILYCNKYERLTLHHNIYIYIF